ncbi:MAG: histidine phosphatase family protein [Acidimicrobiia bacterium]
MPGPATNVLLLRHGQSEWNAEGRWQGLADPPLSDLGRQQAYVAVQHLGTVDDIVASDLQRAAQTAEILSNGIGVGPVLLDPRLRERDAGEWTGLTRHDIELRWPGALERGDKPNGYEADDVIISRVMSALSDVQRNAPGGDVLVVAHGGVIRAVERHLGAEDGLLPNLGGRWLVMRADHVALGERVVLIHPDEVAVTLPGHL